MTLSAQLIAPGKALPHTALPPVVFLNGHQDICLNSTFATTFGAADMVLQTNGQVSVFFNNCSVSGKPSIEKLGSAFRDFLAALKYDDGGLVDLVDVVVHSMGGLILRSYLSGKQEQDNTFSPPPITHIRKAVFIATPNFGTGTASFGLGLDPQLDEIGNGSHFLTELATWNDGTDDMRGIDAIAVIGNGGTGQATMRGFDDGVVALTSASLAFYQPGRTRILPLCHTDSGGLTSLTGYCDASVKGIAKMNSSSDDTARIVLSFLNGTAEWQTIGHAAEQNAFLSTGSGIYVRPFTAAGAPQKLNSATATSSNGTNKKLNMSNDEIAFTDLFPAGQITVVANASSGAMTQSAALPPGTEQTLIVKPGPNISRVLPAAAPVFPLSFAPRMIVSIYGSNLAPSPNDATVFLDGQPVTLLYVSQSQINAVLPVSTAGFSTLKVQNSQGASTVNLIFESARPVVFTVDAIGTAAAINARTGQVVSASNPLQANDYIELFLTGLGQTTRQGDLDVANRMPSVTIDGVPCAVTYAGAAPGIPGLDQINCRTPSGLASNHSATLLVTSGIRTSNPARLPIQ